MIQCSNGDKYEKEHDILLEKLSENIISDEDFINHSSLLDREFKGVVG